MQVDVRITVLTNEGVPILGSARIDYVPDVPSGDENLRRCVERADEFVEAARDAVKAQARLVREDDARIAAEQAAAEQQERPGRRGHR